MGIFDGIQENLDVIAGKVGLPPEQVQNITNTLEATAAQHGVSVDTVQQLLDHGGIADQVTGFAKNFLKS